MDKKTFIKSFFPDTVEDMSLVEINLDITDLSIADILRNINRNFPKNSKERNKIKDGEKIISIVCKSEYLEPLSGIILLITNDDTKIDILSKNYMVITISEDYIKNDEGIKYCLNGLTSYLCQAYKDTLLQFETFYVRYIYNEDDLYDD